MEIAIIVIVAFAASTLTFFSGFGLGTILLPVFAIFFPVEIAVALTGVVHLTNNLFKMGLVGKYASKPVLIRFGIPAIIAAFSGAWLLLKLSDLAPIHEYSIGNKIFQITPVKLIIALLLLFISLLEVLPAGRKFQLGGRRLFLGGVLSGFFGGLAGIQGAFRSAFLIKSGLSKEAYIATGVIIASLVDLTRLSVYAASFAASGLTENLTLLISATIAAITGALMGKIMLQKVTFRGIQILVTIMLVLISIALGLGII